MAKRMKPSKGRRVSSKAAKRRTAVARKAARKPKAAAVKPKGKPAPARRKPAAARPKPKRAPVRVKPKRKPAPTKGPSVATLQRRIQELEGQRQAWEHDRAELARWREHHTQLQEQVKAKDSALAFKEKAILDLRRQVEEVKAEIKRKGTSA